MKHSLATLAGVVAALVVSTLALPARATTVIEKDLTDLCNEADMIFVGQVTAKTSGWRDESRKVIETTVTFHVLEAVYGVTTDDVTLRFGGGEADGLREVVAGMPEFEVGEQVMLFASKQPSISPVVGFHQGCFRVVESGGRRVVLGAEREPVTGLSGRGIFFGKSADGPSGAVPLDQFVESVRARLEERGK